MDLFIRKDVGAFFRMFFYGYYGDLSFMGFEVNCVSISFFEVTSAMSIDFYSYFFLMNIGVVQVSPTNSRGELEVF